MLFSVISCECMFMSCRFCRLMWILFFLIVWIGESGMLLVRLNILCMVCGLKKGSFM